MTGTDDDFLGRWSRRKRASEHSKAPVSPEPEHERDLAEVPELPSETVTLTDEELEALPRVEDLVEGSDIKAFLREGVPRALRSAALRRVWMLTPAIRDYKNPAVDYAWDWNTPGGVPGDGCAPSPERAAQMLRDLFAPRASAVAAETEATELPAESDTKEAECAEPVVMSSRIGESDAPMSLAGQIPDAVSEAPSEADPSRELPQSNRHRHGGALPS